MLNEFCHDCLYGLGLGPDLLLIDIVLFLPRTEIDQLDAYQPFNTR